MDNLAESLQTRTLFKFIIGINNFDREDIRFLTQVYTLAGADIIDVAARPDVVASARDAMTQLREGFPDRPQTSKIMASLALDRDPHAEKAKAHFEHRALIVPADAAALTETVRACLDAGAEMFELHASDSDDAALNAAVEALSAAIDGRYLSVCLGTGGLRSTRDAIRQARLVQAIHGPRTMIQAEGITLAKDGSPASSVQGLALAQALLAKTATYVVMAGGANHWTRTLTDMLGIPVHGIASGSYARNLVEGHTPAGPDPANLMAAATVATRFACHARGVPYREV